MLDPDTLSFRPSQQRATDVLGALVAPDYAWRAAPLDDLLEGANHAYDRQRPTHSDAQPLPVENIKYAE